MLVRRAKHSEFPSVLLLAKDIFPESEISISREDVLFVAKEGRKIIGFAHLRVGKKGFVLQGIGVAREFRGKGIGSSLLDAALSYCRGVGAGRIALGVEESNLAAAGAYARHGFVVSRHRGKTVLMQKAVPTG